MIYTRLNDDKKIRHEVCKRTLDDMYFNAILHIIITFGVFANTIMMLNVLGSDNVKNVLIAYIITSGIYIILSVVKSSLCFVGLLPYSKEYDLWMNSIWIIHYIMIISVACASVSNENKTLTLIYTCIIVYLCIIMYNYLNSINHFLRYVKENYTVNDETQGIYRGIFCNIVCSLFLMHMWIYNFNLRYSNIIYILTISNILICALMILPTYKIIKNIDCDSDVIMIFILISFAIVCLAPIFFFFIFFPYHGWVIDKNNVIGSMIRNIVSLVEGGIVMLSLVVLIIYFIVRCVKNTKKYINDQYNNVSNELNNNMNVNDDTIVEENDI